MDFEPTFLHIMDDPYIVHTLLYASAMQLEKFSTVMIGFLVKLWTMYRGRNE